MPDITNSVSFQIDKEAVVTEYPNRREYSRWDDALAQGLIEQKGKAVYLNGPKSIEDMLPWSGFMQENYPKVKPKGYVVKLVEMK